MRSFWKDTIVVIRPNTAESRGSTIFDWNNAVRQQIKHCNVQPSSSIISKDGRTLAIDKSMTAFIPAGKDIRPSDRIEYDGSVYEITDGPREWYSPTGRVSHIEVSLERWSG